MRLRLAIAGTVAALCAPSPAWCQSAPSTGKAGSYPVKPIRFIVPCLAGGTADVLWRALAEKLTKSFGPHVLLDFRPGVGCSLGSDLATKARPEEYAAFIRAEVPRWGRAVRDASLIGRALE